MRGNSANSSRVSTPDQPRLITLKPASSANADDYRVPALTRRAHQRAHRGRKDGRERACRCGAADRRLTLPQSAAAHSLVGRRDTRRAKPNCPALIGGAFHAKESRAPGRHVRRRQSPEEPGRPLSLRHRQLAADRPRPPWNALRPTARVRHSKRGVLPRPGCELPDRARHRLSGMSRLLIPLCQV
jgi:hypothetical protein